MTEPFDIVIFGGAGDLAFRKIIPALYRSYCEEKLPASSRVIACCRNEQEKSAYLPNVDKALQEHLAEGEYKAESAAAFAEHVYPVELDIAESGERWQAIADLLNEYSQRVRVYYLAIPPAIFVQNLMALRFTNVIFEQLWDAKSIDHVQISISETVGLEGRAGFYNEAGALRDMVQNHLLQLLCLVAMESPHKMNANSIRAAGIFAADEWRRSKASYGERSVCRRQSQRKLGSRLP